MDYWHDGCIFIEKNQKTATMNAIKKDISKLGISKKHIEEWAKSCLKSKFDEGWEIFKVYNADYIYAVKIRIQYSDDELKLNEDGYKYEQIFLNINKTKDYLFLKSKGYDVDSLIIT